MVIIIEFLVVSYLLYTLTVSVYKSYQIDRHIANFKKENDQIAEQNRQKEADYNYFSSEAYIEKIAKQNLGLINPGEEVIVVPNTNNNTNDITADIKNNMETAVRVRSLNNSQKWWKLFFDISQQRQ